MTTRMLLVGEHTLEREGIIQLLAADPEIEVVGEADTGPDAVAQVRVLTPNIVLMDHYTPGLDGVGTTKLIKQESPATEIILLSASSEESDILNAVQAGARGYVLKSMDAGTLIRQIRQVMAGDVAIPEAMIGKLVSGLARKSHPLRNDLKGPATNLTQQEKRVLALITKGMTNKEISAELFVSGNTVRAHIRSLMQKLTMDNRTQLAIYGIREGYGSDGTKRGSQIVA